MTLPIRTEADFIVSRLRGFLSVFGPLSVGDISRFTTIDVGDVTASLHILQREGYKFGIYPTVADAVKARKTAQDAPEEEDTGIGSTPVVESGTGQDESSPLASDDRIQDAVQKMMDTIPKQDTRPHSVDELPALASSHLAALIADYRRVIDEWRLMKLQVDDSNGLREEMQQLRETNNRLLIDSLAYIALKEKLRGMLDAD